MDTEGRNEDQPLEATAGVSLERKAKESSRLSVFIYPYWCSTLALTFSTYKSQKLPATPDQQARKRRLVQDHGTAPLRWNGQVFLVRVDSGGEVKVCTS
ncbi:hypothetical protein AVEN_134446-1 [Araneus ventricosus]|uniref:Uncharacterized protein n=1 Tax=Araneus ventricosus TaxID=182803 RepID=A0A4Y2K4S6_ARAVE|nr:hypothetical protein AVEN_134446-1 [Araneus ventricosus]